MLRVDLRPSYQLALIQVTAHAASGVVTILLHVPLAAKLAISFLIGVSLVHALSHHAFRRGSSALVAIELRENGTIAVQTRDGTWRDVHMLGTSYVTPLLTVLNMKLDGFRFTRHLVVMPDMIEADDYRQLRVRLRWKKKPAEGATCVNADQGGARFRSSAS